MLYLYSKRWSTANLWHYVLERDTLPENAEAWLKVFQNDEPGIEFVLSDKMPKIKKARA